MRWWSLLNIFDQSLICYLSLDTVDDSSFEQPSPSVMETGVSRLSERDCGAGDRMLFVQAQCYSLMGSRSYTSILSFRDHDERAFLIAIVACFCIQLLVSSVCVFLLLQFARVLVLSNWWVGYTAHCNTSGLCRCLRSTVSTHSMRDLRCFIFFFLFFLSRWLCVVSSVIVSPVKYN